MVDILKFDYAHVTDIVEDKHGDIPKGIYQGTNTSKVLIAALTKGGRVCLSAWSHIYRRAALEEINVVYESERKIGSEDYLFNLCCLLKSRTIMVVHDVLYFYEQRNGSLTQMYRDRLTEQYELLYEKLLYYYQQNDKENRYVKLIHRYYASHLVLGTCITHEYNHVDERHLIKERRRKVKDLLRRSSLKRALICGDFRGTNLKGKIIFAMMYLQMEPFFYWLYVGKRR